MIGRGPLPAERIGEFVDTPTYGVVEVEPIG